MLGLMVIFAFVVYLLISILVVIGVARLARERRVHLMHHMM